jgi:hypothetical protein
MISAARGCFAEPGPAAAQPGANARAEIAARAFERMLQCVLATLDRHPLHFAAFLPAFLRLYGHAALMAMSASSLQRMRAKTRVLLTRFISRALLCPMYTRPWLDAQRGEGTPLGAGLSRSHEIWGRGLGSWVIKFIPDLHLRP